ncbi:DUF2798 domain-containing protein [Bacillus sp. EB600]|uniref:DUF2798 domain-containing protein n=1 Tax=Bacillus sp. EB600 TaxID=2806345 RepID=UPI00210E4A30|nr:DUF2798 domain-containing protein [Bacillus sp. EB600]MCQ6279284.1 DUF2798 domain-containing protein [Bacillus sp. EB600]
MKINKKYEQLVFTFFMALGMSIFISFVLVSINFGYSHTFFKIWVKIWSEAFLCAFPVAYFLPKGIKKIMKTFTFVESRNYKKKSDAV